jgi:hypothetical protein
MAAFYFVTDINDLHFSENLILGMFDLPISGIIIQEIPDLLFQSLNAPVNGGGFLPSDELA